MADPPDGLSSPPDVPIPTFSKIVNVCLHDLKEFEDLWFPLTQSESTETSKTLAGMTFKILLNDALKDEQIRENVDKIVAENEPIHFSKLRYLESYPEWIKRSLMLQIPELFNKTFAIEILESTCRLTISQKEILAEFPIGEEFKWPLFYAQFMTTIPLQLFRVSVLEGDRELREETLNKFSQLFKQTSMSVNENCTVECYRETFFHFDGRKGSNAYYQIKACTDARHKRCPQPKRDDSPERDGEDYRPMRQQLRYWEDVLLRRYEREHRNAEHLRMRIE